MTLTDFLLARLAEDETVAREAGARTWTVADHESREGRVEASTGDVVVYDEGAPTGTQALHIARWDPARVLADCAAKRAIVDSRESCEAMYVQETDLVVQLTGGGMTEGLAVAMKYLALPYADHPDYDEAWRP